MTPRCESVSTWGEPTLAGARPRDATVVEGQLAAASISKASTRAGRAGLRARRRRRPLAPRRGRTHRRSDRPRSPPAVRATAHSGRSGRSRLSIRQRCIRRSATSTKTPRRGEWTRGRSGLADSPDRGRDRVAVRQTPAAGSRYPWMPWPSRTASTARSCGSSDRTARTPGRRGSVLCARRRLHVSGYYRVGRLPGHDQPSVHVSFPLEQGNVQVYLRPSNGPGGAMTLSSPPGRSATTVRTSW